MTDRHAQTPAACAKALQFYAERSDECEKHQRAGGDSYRAAHYQHQARRLRAMAMLAERSTAATAGEVDFRRLYDPGLGREAETIIIEEIEAEQRGLTRVDVYV